MLNYKNNPIFSKEPYYDKESNVCVLLSEKAIFSPLGRIDRRAFVLLILIDILMYFASFCILMLWDKLTGLGILDNKFAGLSYFLMCNYLMFVIVSKRLHDIGKSMRLSLLYVMTILSSLLSDKFSYIPYFIAIVLIILACIPGEKRDNAYGARVEILKLCSDNIIKGKINHNIECPNINFNVARGFNAVKNVISNNVMFSILKNNKKKLSLTLIVFILVGCAGYYLYIPKMSDVERYRDNNDVAAMSNLIEKAISFEERDPKYKNIRDQAIIALADMNTPDGNKFLKAYLNSDDRKIDLDLKKGIFKALLAKNNNFLDEFVVTRLQKSSKEKKALYDELLYVARDETTRDQTFKSNDFVERKIAMDIIKNMKNSTDNTYIDFIKNNNFKCAKPDSSRDEFRYLLSSYIIVSDELDDFDNKKIKEIDRQIEDIVEERKQIALYLQNVDEITRNMVREVYITQGVNKALEYQTRAINNAIDKEKRYWQLVSKLEKLNYEKSNLGNRKYDLKNKQQLYYGKLKAYVNNETSNTNIQDYDTTRTQDNSGNSENMSNDLLGLNWNTGFIYMQKLKFELKSDGGFLVYSDKNASIIKMRLSDCLPDSIHVSSSKVVLAKNGDTIRSVQLECDGSDWNTAYNYLKNKYGDTDSRFSEASKERYRAVWIRNDRGIALNYEKKDSKLEVECFDKKYFY
ncbi:DUF805 domain-containing protein [Phascolarctobacterium succinatutens]|uniref:DUF805 domain-containing protein n=1 Tax=Phascolarctobacterium succinatutens TaxID=626940 RepID=UPI0026ECBB47|nr:DUF805 domain-containing protein [Phascolarctobacterium succinatutens]